MSQNFTEPVWINFDGYGPKLILNDSNTSNKVPIEFRTNNVVKWELGLRPLSSNHDFALWNNYNGTYFPVMWFKYDNQFVGIGTKSPTAKLEVESSGSVYHGSPTLLIKDKTSRGTVFLESVADNPTDFVFKNNDRISWAISTRASSENYSLRFFPSVNGTSFHDPALNLLTNGDVGIGTTEPTVKLEIESSGSDYNGSPTLLIKDITNRGTMFLESVADNPTDFIFKNNDRFSWTISTRASSENYALRFFPSVNGTSFQTPVLTLLTNGSVGIGTTNPGNFKLAVEGTIGAREIKVSLDSWSDFVFESDYRLKELEEVEEFINNNNRLPDIPSGNEVVKNGINLGEMDAKLLQKIEELTLYTIEQQKQLERQMELIEKLELKLEKNGIN